MATDHRPLASGSTARSRTLLDVGLRTLRRLREAQSAQDELRERVVLRQDPWREDLMHWSHDGVEWRLHGSRLPRPDGRRRSVTRNGWCPALSSPSR